MVTLTQDEPCILGMSRTGLLLPIFSCPWEISLFGFWSNFCLCCWSCIGSFRFGEHGEAEMCSIRTLFAFASFACHGVLICRLNLLRTPRLTGPGSVNRQHKQTSQLHLARTSTELLRYSINSPLNAVQAWMKEKARSVPNPNAAEMQPVSLLFYPEHIPFRSSRCSSAICYGT